MKILGATPKLGSMPGILLGFMLHGISLAIAQPVQPEGTVLEAAASRLQRAHAYTALVAESMPDSLYHFRPTPEAMTFARQLTHLCSNLGRLSGEFLGDTLNPVSEQHLDYASKDEVVNLIDRTYHFAMRKLETLSPSALTDTVNFFAGPLTKLQVVNLVFDHQTHHRAQALVYLRLNGIEPPRYTGW